jgi:two-component system, cell cycle response regulator
MMGKGHSVARVLVVDDSPSVRALLRERLCAHGYDVEEAPTGESGAERAIACPPDVIVTDLVMAGLSGVQLCRLLRNDPATAHVPVVLLTASGDKRSRFWARSAGAAAYVGKDRLDDLVLLLPTLLAAHAASPPAAMDRGGRGRTLYERISSILDAQLFDSVVAGEIRALTSAGELPRLFEGLVSLLNDVLSYRWLALMPARPYAPLLMHGHPDERDAVEAMARSALAVDPTRKALFTEDERAVPGEGGPADTLAVTFAGQHIGHIALGPSWRGISREEKRVLSLVGSEIGGPLQMTALYEDARRLATVDMLTGLLNRRAFLDNMEREHSRSTRHMYPLSVLLLDVDHFKRVNDTRGHAAGDAVLQGVAQVLTRVARRSDIVARWGGEEFVIALPQTGEAGARIAAERVRRAIAEATFPLPGGEGLGVTASIGAASALAPWVTDAVIAAADEAMYAAKARGRNRVESDFEPEVPSAVRRPFVPAVSDAASKDG